jgi:hypothetical protein
LPSDTAAGANSRAQVGELAIITTDAFKQGVVSSGFDGVQGAETGT